VRGRFRARTLGALIILAVVGPAGWPAAGAAAMRVPIDVRAPQPEPVDISAFATNGAPVILLASDTSGLPFDVGGARDGMNITVDLDLTHLPGGVHLGGVYFLHYFPQPSCQRTETHLTCALAPGAGRYLSGGLVVRVPADALPASGSYQVTVTSDQPDPDPSDNTLTVAVRVQGVPTADLEFATTPVSGAVGDLVAVLVRVTNHGPDALDGWRRLVTAPSGTTYQGCVPDPGACEDGFTLPVGGSATMALTFRIDSLDIGPGGWMFEPRTRDPDPTSNVLPTLGSLIQVTGPARAPEPRAGSPRVGAMASSEVPERTGRHPLSAAVGPPGSAPPAVHAAPTHAPAFRPLRTSAPMPVLVTTAAPGTAPPPDLVIVGGVPWTPPAGVGRIWALLALTVTPVLFVVIAGLLLGRGRGRHISS
jgi:hypothetical protein